MKKKIAGGFFLLVVIFTSVAVMILPTFFTKGVSRTALKQPFELPLLLNDKKDIKLLFFGYAGCSDICTPRLQAINKFYTSLSKREQRRVGVEFVDISSPADKTLPNRFANYFNNDFKGIYLEQNILRDYTKAFHVFFSQSLLDKMEYDHSANLYLVKRDKGIKEIRYIYNSYPYDIEQLKLDTEELLNE